MRVLVVEARHIHGGSSPLSPMILMLTDPIPALEGRSLVAQQQGDWRDWRVRETVEGADARFAEMMKAMVFTCPPRVLVVDASGVSMIGKGKMFSGIDEFISEVWRQFVRGDGSVL